METFDKSQFIREQISKDGRKESTTVNGHLYDVMVLEQWLENNPDKVKSVEMQISDPRLQDAVAEHQYYWDDTEGGRLGPYDFLQKWSVYQTSHGSADVDEFLDSLQTENPTWKNHIDSLRYAKNNLQRPIWMMESQSQGYPFDGIHRLTRSILEGKETIPALMWSKVPEEALLRKAQN